jgi:GntR family transcriptional regulator/MocR family aminotransferase
MPGVGSTSSPELLLPPLGGAGGRRAQLEGHLREAVRSGRLRAGARLPSSRTLSVELGISRRMVVDAYAQLVAEGYLVARRGSGTRVAPRAMPGAVAPVSCGGTSAAARIDLFPGSPDLSLFPRRAWARALRHVLATTADDRLGYASPEGAPELREALAEHLARVRGAHADPARIVVTSGYQQGLRLVCGLMRRAGGRRMAMEDPGYPIAALGIEAAGLEVVPVPLDDHGLDVDVLASSGANGVVVTPAHAMPTGAVLAPQRRADLLAWAQDAGALVLEDDYDAEFRYDRDPLGVLQGLASERVILAGTVSKTLAPGLRLGWLLLPAALAGQAALLRGLGDGGANVLEPLALARLLRTGAFDRHVRTARQRYRARRAVLLDALGEHLPAARVRGVAAGLHVLVELPSGADEEAVVAAAERRGVRAYGLAAHTRVHHRPPALVLGYAATSERELREAAVVLADAVRG